MYWVKHIFQFLEFYFYYYYLLLVITNPVTFRGLIWDTISVVAISTTNSNAESFSQIRALANIPIFLRNTDIFGIVLIISHYCWLSSELVDWFISNLTEWLIFQLLGTYRKILHLNRIKIIIFCTTW